MKRSKIQSDNLSHCVVETQHLQSLAEGISGRESVTYHFGLYKTLVKALLSELDCNWDSMTWAMPHEKRKCQVLPLPSPQWPLSEGH